MSTKTTKRQPTQSELDYINENITNIGKIGNQRVLISFEGKVEKYVTQKDGKLEIIERIRE